MMRSIVARSIDGGSKPKSRPPSGYQRVGLCLADPLALQILRCPIGQHPSPEGGIEWNGDTVIVEGEPDYITVATIKNRVQNGRTYACLGWLGSGGLELEICQRIPENSRVYVFIQRDKPGKNGERAGERAAMGTLERLASLEKGLELFIVEMASLEEELELEEGEGGKDLNDLQRVIGQPLLWPLVARPAPSPAPSPLVSGEVQASLSSAISSNSSPSSGLNWLTGVDLWPAAPPPPPDWLLLEPASNGLEKGRGVIPFGKVGLFGAPGGTGKTWALSSLALAVITGRSWFSSSPDKGDKRRGWLDIGKRGRVLVIGGEDTREDIQRRYYETALSIGLEEEERLACLSGLVALSGAGQALQLLSKDGHRTQFLECLESKLEGEPFGLIILDPLARFSPADSETDSHIATRLIEILERLTGKGARPPTVIAAHHTRKGAAGADKTEVSSGDFRGSSALIDGARFGLMLERLALPSGDGGRPWKGLEDLTGLARLSVVKSNVGTIPAPFLVGRRKGGGALTGLSELELESMERAKGASPSRPSPNRSKVGGVPT
jgi:hypothetical protein